MKFFVPLDLAPQNVDALGVLYFRSDCRSSAARQKNQQLNRLHRLTQLAKRRDQKSGCSPPSITRAINIGGTRRGITQSRRSQTHTRPCETIILSSPRVATRPRASRAMRLCLLAMSVLGPRTKPP